MFFDTETNGLPLNFDKDDLSPGNWPSMVQLAWVIADEKGREVERREFLIELPEGEEEDEKAVAIHGKTKELLRDKGVRLVEVFKVYLDDLYKCDVVVAHNLDFDLGVVVSNFKNRLNVGIGNCFLGRKVVCTMALGSKLDIGNYGLSRWEKAWNWIRGKKGHKRNSLKKLHMYLFGKDFENAHDAMGDVEAMKNCYYELVKRNVI